MNLVTKGLCFARPSRHGFDNEVGVNQVGKFAADKGFDNQSNALYQSVAGETSHVKGSPPVYLLNDALRSFSRDSRLFAISAITVLIIVIRAGVNEPRLLVHRPAER